MVISAYHFLMRKLIQLETNPSKNSPFFVNAFPAQQKTSQKRRSPPDSHPSKGPNDDKNREKMAFSHAPKKICLSLGSTCLLRD